MDVIPDPNNLPVEAMPWARAMTKLVQGLIGSNVGNQQRTGNVLQQLQATVQSLSNNISNLTARFNTAISTMTFDAGQVVSGIFNVSRIPIIPASQVSGTWTNDTSVNNATATSVFALNAGLIAGNITTSRTSTWARNSDGYIGNTLSSILYKTNVRESDINPLAVLSIIPKYYQYIAEVAKRDDPSSEGYVGPDYHVALEIGMIAEELHAAGLWQFVVYEHNADGGLVYDKNGNVVPQSIHYINWAIALQVVVRYQQGRIDNLESRLAVLESKVN